MITITLYVIKFSPVAASGTIAQNLIAIAQTHRANDENSAMSQSSAPVRVDKSEAKKKSPKISLSCAIPITESPEFCNRVDKIRTQNVKLWSLEESSSAAHTGDTCWSRSQANARVDRERKSTGGASRNLGSLEEKTCRLEQHVFAARCRTKRADSLNLI